MPRSTGEGRNLEVSFRADLHVTPRVSMWTSLNPHAPTLSPASTSLGGQAQGAWSTGAHALSRIGSKVFLFLESKQKERITYSR
jgi:hypothetical protein